jgi:hypothetical protein
MQTKVTDFIQHATGYEPFYWYPGASDLQCLALKGNNMELALTAHIRLMPPLVADFFFFFFQMDINSPAC